MSKISKVFLLLLVVSLAISSLIIRSSNAQIGVTKPSVPAFSIMLQTYQQYIPPTYSVDPSTGKAVMTEEGYTQVEKWIRVDIGGQPFLRYNNSDGQLISLFYNVRWKENHNTSWEYLPQDIHYGDAAEPWDTQAIGRLISIGFKGIPNGGVAEGYMSLLDPTATHLDFQVEALMGYYTMDNVFVGQSSGWSNTQTLNVSDGSITTNSTMTKQTGNFDWEQIAIIVLGVTVVVLAFALVLSRRRSTMQLAVPSNA